MATPTRYALVTGGLNVSLNLVQQYLPSNYYAHQLGEQVFIIGTDNAGWTLDGYVIPRLSSGLIAAREIGEEEAILLNTAQAEQEDCDSWSNEACRLQDALDACKLVLRDLAYVLNRTGVLFVLSDEPVIRKLIEEHTHNCGAFLSPKQRYWLNLPLSRQDVQSLRGWLSDEKWEHLLRYEDKHGAVRREEVCF